ncbi:MAG: S8 family peptidase [Halobacteriaceae archaeon]
MPENISRRQLLGGTVAGLGAIGLAGSGFASNSRPDEYNIGVESKAAKRKVTKAATEINRVFSWNNGRATITGRFPEEALSGLRNRPDVRYIEKNASMKAINSGQPSNQTLPWGIDRVDADVLHENGETGGDSNGRSSGADIAIIDTGIDSDHPDLEPNLGEGKAFVEAGSKYAKPWDDDNGHGTHVAGTADAVDNNSGVVGVSTEATIHAVKVLNKYGFGSFADVAAGIEWVADQGYDVANMSLGGGKSYVVEDAVEFAYEAGVLLVGAAGNFGPCEGCVNYPAREPEVMAVSATAEDDTLATFSSTGPSVDLAAPGARIYSTYAGGKYATLSGTSMAAPHVTGAAAQLVDNGYDNYESRDILEQSAEDLALGPNEQGYGLLDVAAALNYDSSDSVAEQQSSVEPRINDITVTTEDGPAGTTNVEVSWNITDEDGDLQSVHLTLTELSRTGLAQEVEDTASVSISGEESNETGTLTADGDSAEGYQITIVVSDAVGNQRSQTTTI